jgi:hypothetical protein
MQARRQCESPERAWEMDDPLQPGKESNDSRSIQYTDESYQIVESNKLVDSCRARGLESERLFGQKEIVLR